VNSDLPLVSVVIPAFNAASHLPQALESALGQTWRQLEVIVVDDGSTDTTPDLVAEVAARDSRVRLIRQPNAGVGAARNTGIQAARGRYIAPLDADDLWAPRKLELQVAEMERAGPHAGLAYCWLRSVDQQNRLLAWATPITISGPSGAAMMLANFVGNASTPLFRASALATVGLYLTRAEQHGAQGCEDWDLHLRIAERFSFCCVPAHLVSYRQGATNMSLNAASMTTSYEVTVRRARERNPHLPAKLFRWSAARFYGYLVRRCYCWSDYSGALRYLRKGFATDHAFWLHLGHYRIGAAALFHLTTTGALRRHREPPPLCPSPDPGFQTAAPTGTTTRRGLFARTQNRRLEWALKLTPNAHPHVHIDRAFGY
jgi:glycosyltransferase involved in cell wall biosynthesis